MCPLIYKPNRAQWRFWNSHKTQYPNSYYNNTTKWIFCKDVL